MTPAALLTNITRIAEQLAQQLENHDAEHELDLHTIGAMLVAQGEMALGGVVDG